MAQDLVFWIPSSKFKLASSVDCGPTLNSSLATPLYLTHYSQDFPQLMFIALIQVPSIVLTLLQTLYNWDLA